MWILGLKGLKQKSCILPPCLIQMTLFYHHDSFRFVLIENKVIF